MRDFLNEKMVGNDYSNTFLYGALKAQTSTYKTIEKPSNW